MVPQYIGEKPDRYEFSEKGLQRAALELAHSDAGYEFGKESPEGTDCSGILSYALTRCGRPIRMTADGFYRFIWTEKTIHTFNRSELIDFPAAFIITGQKHQFRPGYNREKGQAVHVAPFVGPCVVLDANWVYDEIEPVSIEEFMNRHVTNYFYMEIRYPRIEAIELHTGVWADTIDPIAFDYTRIP